jgi:hypothetical protein
LIDVAERQTHQGVIHVGRLHASGFGVLPAIQLEMSASRTAPPR